MGTLKLQRNGPLYRSTVIGSLAVDGWACFYIWYREEGDLVGCGPAQSPLLAVPNVTAHPSMASVPT